MTMTSRQRAWVSVGLVALLAALIAFGGHYRLLGVLFLPLAMWVGIRREPEQMRIRPWIRVLGWLLVGACVVLLVMAVVSIVAGR